MRIILKLLSAAAAAMTAAGIPTAAAQNTQQYDFSSVSINGLEVDKAYTREQIIDALGEPSIEDEHGYYYFTYISTLVMAPVVDTTRTFRAAKEVADGFGYIRKNGDTLRFQVFFITSDRFAVNDYVRVGDPVSKVYDMGGKTLEEEDRSRIYWAPEGSPDEPWIEWDCYPAFYYDDNGIITDIELYYD